MLRRYELSDGIECLLSVVHGGIVFIRSQEVLGSTGFAAGDRRNEVSTRRPFRRWRVLSFNVAVSHEGSRNTVRVPAIFVDLKGVLKPALSFHRFSSLSHSFSSGAIRELLPDCCDRE
jgi:hypothetical protein